MAKLCGCPGDEIEDCLEHGCRGCGGICSSKRQRTCAVCTGERLCLDCTGRGGRIVDGEVVWEVTG